MRVSIGIVLLVAAGSQAALATPAEDYATYCALCHGEDRRGYANDNAPSLVTKTLFAAGLRVPTGAISYGRPGTPMGPYLDEVGGPMTERQIIALARWLSESAGIEPQRRRTADLAPIRGDATQGQVLYGQHCAECHGENGEGGEGTALGNPTMLATAPDLFLKAAITDGREGTPMRAFSGELSDADIDNLVTFLRSRASGWDVDEMRFARPPTLDDIVLNPGGEAPAFELTDGRYVSADDLHAAIDAGHRMILIDTRVPYFWAMAHIAGSVPVPYYSSREEIIAALPRDGTWIIAYCECPRAAADSAVNRLRRLGYENTAVLWEGYAGWAALGYPIAAGSIDGDGG
ncbi:MAG: c-type cytochrome [Pseudomonadota bacterium]